jgi:ABC-type Na+ efflux pump permease subunit
MTITPIYMRELLVAARRGRLQWNRGMVAVVLVAMVVGTLVVRCYEAGWVASNHLMSLCAHDAFRLAVGYQGVLAFVALTQAAQSIADEKNRRTLDFLLATRLGNAEIVLGKLAACLTVTFTTIAAGLPVMMLFVVLGGLDYRLVLIVYACVASTAFFLASLAIWVSVGAPDVRRSMSRSTLYSLAWLMGPILVSFALPRFGVHLPRWASTVNAWILYSSPMGLVMSLAGGAGARALFRSVAWMIGLQAAGGVVLVIWAIARLRSAYRVNLGGDGTRLERLGQRPVWRFRPRPAVGDDPILWREMYTTRAKGWEKAFGILFYSLILGPLAFGTYYFARPAVIEVWTHGYSSGVTTQQPPEMNLLVRAFVPAGLANSAVDEARTDFNLFLRHMTGLVAFIIALAAMSCSAQVVTTERTRGTWDSLLATPLMAGDIARAQMLAAVWRLRGAIAILLILWTIGLIAGAVHPLGYVVTLLVLAASTWCLVAFGTIASLQPKDSAAMLPLGALLFASPLVWWLPSWCSSVLLGAGSPPFVEWVSLVSYRDVRAGMHYAAFPLFEWMAIHTGEGLLRALALCLIAIVVPAVGGLFACRYVNAHFDRLVGRPWRDAALPADQTVADPVAVRT